jgi:hypothetical protein
MKNGKKNMVCNESEACVCVPGYQGTTAASGNAASGNDRFRVHLFRKRTLVQARIVTTVLTFRAVVLVLPVLLELKPDERGKAKRGRRRRGLVFFPAEPMRGDKAAA